MTPLPCSPSWIVESPEKDQPQTRRAIERSADANAGQYAQARRDVDLARLPITEVSVPCGFSSEGLPIGLQISGPHFGEPSVLTLAHAYERAAGWHARKPELDRP